jgi:hypothetical protein
MRQFWILGAIALFVAVAPVRADVVSPAVRAGGQTVVEVAEKIALGRISQSQAIELLGTQEGAVTLWNAVKALETQKGLPLNATDWASIRKIVATQNLATAAVIGQFKTAADSHTVLTSASASQAFGQAQASVAPSYQVAATTTTSAEEAFVNYVPKSDVTRQFHQSLLGNWSRGTRTRISTIGAMLLLAMNTTPTLCSAASRDYCVQNAPEAVMKWGALGIDKGGDRATKFLNSALTGFQNEAENFVGNEEVIIRGANEALAMGETMPGQVKACFWTGTPAQN